MLTMPNISVLYTAIIAVVVAVIMFAVGVMYRKKVAEREILSAEEEAKRIVKAAEEKGEFCTACLQPAGALSRKAFQTRTDGLCKSLSYLHCMQRRMHSPAEEDRLSRKKLC